MDTDIKSYLSLIYGENVTVIFDTYVFTWDILENNKKSGYIMGVNGAKLITEKIDDVIEVKDRGTGKITGYLVLLNKQQDSLRSMCGKKADRHIIIKENVLVISSQLTFERAKIQSKFYNKQRPDMVLTYNFKRYTAKFNENNEVECFASHS